MVTVARAGKGVVSGEEEEAVSVFLLSGRDAVPAAAFWGLISLVAIDRSSADEASLQHCIAIMETRFPASFRA